MSFAEMIDKGAAIEEIGAHLDSLAHADRVREVMAVNGGHLTKLFERSAVADLSVRGVVLDIDSPGGEVGGLFDLQKTVV